MYEWSKNCTGCGVVMSCSTVRLPDTDGRNNLEYPENASIDRVHNKNRAYTQDNVQLLGTGKKTGSANRTDGVAFGVVGWVFE